jgi:quercetin dioxygenase-like cupin family protein
MTTTHPVPVTASSPSRVFVERTPGVGICVLRAHPDGGLTFLVRMKKGARAPRHGHPGGEESYLLSGKLRVDRRVAADGTPQPDVDLVVGDHLWAPAGEVHEGLAGEDDTTFLVVAPGGIDRSPAAG